MQYPPNISHPTPTEIVENMPKKKVKLTSMSCRASWNCSCTCADGWWTPSIEFHHYSFPIWKGVSMSALTPQINYPICTSTCFFQTLHESSNVNQSIPLVILSYTKIGPCDNWKTAKWYNLIFNNIQHFQFWIGKK